MANRHWEEEMLGEYVAAKLPGARVVLRVRLGPEPIASRDLDLTPEERRFVGNASRRWADAVAVDRGRLLVIETALVPDPRDISLVQTYLELVPVTPELEEWRQLPRAGRLVWAVDDPYSRAVAVRAGLEVDLFRPSHWAEYMAVVRAREGGGPRNPRPVRGNAVVPTSGGLT